jgi:hypothetical protein
MPSPYLEQMNINEYGLFTMSDNASVKQYVFH